MSRTNRSRIKMPLTSPQVFSLVLGLMVILVACTPATPAPTRTPTPTATRSVNRANNKNVDALNAAQATLSQSDFGFAPLLVMDQTRLVIEVKPEGEVARLAYPRQSPNPAEWPTRDSFISAYAIRYALLTSPQVARVALGRFSVAAPVDDLQNRIDHVAAWVRFADGSSAVVDLTPLATNFGALHSATELMTSDEQIEGQFTLWRDGVAMNVLQPMKVIREGSNAYYLLAQVLVSPDLYEFSLRAHPVQPASPIEPLTISRGAMAKVEIKRADFETMHELLVDAGPAAFEQRPALLNRMGSDNSALITILDDHLELLWHLVTKLEDRPSPTSGTPTPTLTPTVTPTPTSTPTPAPLPLSTS